MAIALEDDGLSDTTEPCGRWALCGGRFEVEDRGDGVAEILKVDEFWSMTDEVVAARYSPWRGIGGLTRTLVGAVTDTTLHIDEASYAATRSAFPGLCNIGGTWLPGDIPSQRVDTVHELEQLLTLTIRPGHLHEHASRKGSAPC